MIRAWHYLDTYVTPEECATTQRTRSTDCNRSLELGYKCVRLPSHSARTTTTITILLQGGTLLWAHKAGWRAVIGKLANICCLDYVVGGSCSTRNPLSTASPLEQVDSRIVQTVCTLQLGAVSEQYNIKVVQRSPPKKRRSKISYQ